METENIHAEEVRGRLQATVGDTPKVKLERFENVMRTQEADYVFAVRPQTLQELQRVVRAATLSGLRVRPIGSAYSWSPLFPDAGHVALYTNHLTRHDGPRIELKQTCVGQYEMTALCSVTTAELREFQLEHGVELPANVIFRTATVAGVISTISHGTGTEIAQAVGDLVVRMRIVDGSGNLQTLDTASDPDLMNAARGSLGLFGVIYDVTFKVTRASLDIVTDSWMSLRDTIYNTNNLKRLIFEYDSMEMFWFPYSSLTHNEAFKVMLRDHLLPGEWNALEDKVMIHSVTKAPPGSVLSGERVTEWDSPLDKWEYIIGKYSVARKPSCAPLVIGTGQKDFKEIFNGSVIQKHVNAVHFLKGVSSYRVWETEFCFNLDVDCLNIVRAIDDIKQDLTSSGLQGRFPISVIVEMRICRASDLYLAPGYIAQPCRGGSGYSVHLEIVSLAKTKHFYSFASQLALKWMSRFGARPHWGKQWSFIPGIIPYLQQTLSTELALFRRALEHCGIDPCRTFFNSSLENLVYGIQTGSSSNACSYRKLRHPVVGGIVAVKVSP